MTTLDYPQHAKITRALRPSGRRPSRVCSLCHGITRLESSNVSGCCLEAPPVVVHSIIRSRQLTFAVPREQCPLYGERAACAVGTWTDGVTTATACVTCPPGTFYPTDITNTTCTLCPPGTFNDVRAKGVRPQYAVEPNENTSAEFSRS